MAEALAARGASLWNMYGPTETTIWSAVRRIDRGDTRPLIGRAIANTTIYVLDQNLKPVPVGVAGEMYIGGDGLARGYFNRPDLTARNLCPPRSAASRAQGSTGRETVCRTHSCGSLEFLERVDQQIKVRGYCIELGEIGPFCASIPE